MCSIDDRESISEESCYTRLRFSFGKDGALILRQRDASGTPWAILQSLLRKFHELMWLIMD